MRIFKGATSQYFDNFIDGLNQIKVLGNLKIIVFQGRKTPKRLLNVLKQKGTRMAEYGED